MTWLPVPGGPFQNVLEIDDLLGTNMSRVYTENEENTVH